MGKIILAILTGLVGAAVVHIAVIFTMPAVADNNAWGRLSRIGDVFEVVKIASLRSESIGNAGQAEGSETHDFAFVDPAFVTAGCRFSLADGPVRLVATARTDFWSASIYSRQGDNLYSINDRVAVDGRFDLLVGTTEQLVEARVNSADRSETAIPVEVNIDEGYLTLRVLVDEESARPGVDAFAQSVTCAPSELPATPEAEGGGEG